MVNITSIFVIFGESIHHYEVKKDRGISQTPENSGFIG